LTFEQEAMAAAVEARMGVANSAAPLQVFEARFSTKGIGQSLPLTGASNMISVTLLPNCDLPSASRATVTSLTGSLTPNSALEPFNVTSAPALSFEDLAEWNQTSGVVVLTVGSGGLSAGVEYVVSFWLRNPAEEQDSPDVSVSSFGEVRSKSLAHTHTHT